jgi:hypothetical protein
MPAREHDGMALQLFEAEQFRAWYCRIAITAPRIPLACKKTDG